MKTIMTAEVNGHGSRRQQKKRWADMIQQDMKPLGLKKEHTGDQRKWRRRIRGSDLSPLPWEGLIQTGRKHILNQPNPPLPQGSQTVSFH